MVGKKRQARPSPPPPAPRRKNFFCPNRGLSWFVATLQGFVSIPDVVSGFAFSRALRGWGQSRFHRPFPPLWGSSSIVLNPPWLAKKGRRAHRHHPPPPAGKIFFALIGVCLGSLRLFRGSLVSPTWFPALPFPVPCGAGGKAGSTVRFHRCGVLHQ